MCKRFPSAESLVCSFKEKLLRRNMFPHCLLRAASLNQRKFIIKFKGIMITKLYL